MKQVYAQDRHKDVYPNSLRCLHCLGIYSGLEMANENPNTSVAPTNNLVGNLRKSRTALNFYSLIYDPTYFWIWKVFYFIFPPSKPHVPTDAHITMRTCLYAMDLFFKSKTTKSNFKLNIVLIHHWNYIYIYIHMYHVYKMRLSCI